MALCSLAGSERKNRSDESGQTKIRTKLVQNIARERRRLAV
jgi:hypothetical protein